MNKQKLHTMLFPIYQEIIHKYLPDESLYEKFVDALEIRMMEEFEHKVFLNTITTRQIKIIVFHLKSLMEADRKIKRFKGYPDPVIRDNKIRAGRMLKDMHNRHLLSQIQRYYYTTFHSA